MSREWVISEDDLGCDGSYLSYDEVVRCRNCRYFAIVNQPYDQTWCGVMQDSVKPDGYCYKGEVRDDD